MPSRPRPSGDLRRRGAQGPFSVRRCMLGVTGYVRGRRGMTRSPSGGTPCGTPRLPGGRVSGERSFTCVADARLTPDPRPRRLNGLPRPQIGRPGRLEPGKGGRGAIRRPQGEGVVIGTGRSRSPGRLLLPHHAPCPSSAPAPTTPAIVPPRPALKWMWDRRPAFETQGPRPELYPGSATRGAKRSAAIAQITSAAATCSGDAVGGSVMRSAVRFHPTMSLKWTSG